MSIYLDLFWTFFRIGLFTFGGGLAMLPLLEKEVVSNKHWATYDELVDYYAIGQCTPGIIAVNTATFVGYSQKKVPGAIVATAGIVCPSLIIILLIASLMTSFADQPIVQHALAGIRIAVCVLIAQAVIRLFKKGVKDIFGVILFAVVLLATYFNLIPVAGAVVLAAVAGILYCVIVQKRTGRSPAAKEAKKDEQQAKEQLSQSKAPQAEEVSKTSEASQVSKAESPAKAAANLENSTLVSNNRKSNSTSSSHEMASDSKESVNLTHTTDKQDAQASSITNTAHAASASSNADDLNSSKAVSSGLKADEMSAENKDKLHNPEMTQNPGEKGSEDHA